MSMPYFKTASRVTLSHVLAWELAPEHGVSRTILTILAGDGSNRILRIGTVMGRRLFGDPVVAAGGGNTGTGTLADVVLGDAARTGVYTVTCIEAAAGGGRFQVVDPGGYRLADALVGTAADTPQIQFLLSAGGTDFAVGDTMTVTVPEGDMKAVALDPSATDGTQLAAAVLAEDVTAFDGSDAQASAVVSDAILADGGLIWPEGITGDQKAAALDRFAAAGMTVRRQA